VGGDHINIGSIEVLEKKEFQITNHQSQTNNNNQSVSGGPKLFWSLNIGI
jgi:hypothetical protein